MNSDRVKIILGFVVISLIWGSTWLVIKIGLQSMTPLYGVLLRFLLALIILYGLAKWEKIEIPWDRNAVFLYLNLGLLSFGIPFTLVYWGEQHIGSGLAAVLFAIFPFIIAIGSHLFLPSEPLNFGKSIGVALGFIGILTIFWDDISKSNENLSGMSAILLSTLMQGTALIILKRKYVQISPVALSFGGLLFAVCIIAPMALILDDFKQLHFDLAGLGSIFYLGTMGTVVTLVVYYWLIKKVEVIYLSLVSFVTPIIAVILGVLILEEMFTTRMIIGGGLVLSGILTANSKLIFRMINNYLPYKRNNY